MYLRDVVGGGDHDESGHDKLSSKRQLNAPLISDREDVSGEEGGEETDEDTDRCNKKREAEGSPSGFTKSRCLRSNHQCRTSRLSKRSEEVGSHTSDISDIIPHQVGDDSYAIECDKVHGRSRELPGFLGSSSGMPWTTLPTRSAPTSAAFV